MKYRACCFSGHRPQGLPWGFHEADPRCIWLKDSMREKIQHLINKCGICHFISGMALGIDIYAAELVLEIKQKKPEITLECAIPFQSQPARWSSADQDRYNSILRKCDYKTVLQSYYSPGCYQVRNRYMVDHSDYLFAIWSGQPSGTEKTVAYARRHGRTIIVFSPFLLGE